jgi:hypothetical protein
MTTLNNLLSKKQYYNNKQFIIKVDIEGFEKNFILGAKSTLKQRTIAIILEANKNLKEAGTSIEEITELLKQADMECYTSPAVPNDIIAINKQFMPMNLDTKMISI